MNNRLTTSQLLLHLKLLHDSLDIGEEVFTLYLDFCKAFDKVNHYLLIEKLKNFCIGGRLLQLLSSYLEDRSQWTVINNIYSEYLPINSGVPQGSVLGPLLFLVFVNDLPGVLETSIAYLFADDTKINNTDPALLQNDLPRLHQWSLENKMQFNFSKTSLIWFTLKRKDIKEQPLCVFGEKTFLLLESLLLIWEKVFVIICPGLSISSRKFVKLMVDSSPSKKLAK